MMKNKKVRLFLIVFATLLYAYIAQDIYSKLNPTIPPDAFKQTHEKKKLSKKIKKEYQLIAAYRDPFERKGTSRSYSASVSTGKKATPSIIPKAQNAEKPAMEIRFAGVISNKEK